MSIVAEIDLARVAPVEVPSLTVGDLARLFGPMPLARIRFKPFPGSATEQDVYDLHAKGQQLCELVDGVLVEKPRGFLESYLALALAKFLSVFLDLNPLGIITGEQGSIRLAAGLVRIPDLAYFSWSHFPDRRLPQDPIPLLAPDLAIEILSRINTREEMARKRVDYFRAGCALAWEVDPRTRTVTVYTTADQFTVLTDEQTLDGGAVLPGFTLPLRQLFAEPVKP